MEQLQKDVFSFFDPFPAARPLYEAFEAKLLELFPETKIKVQKTQISFSTRHVYACASFLKAKRKAFLPNPYITVTLSLPYPLETDRTAGKTEPYPGRWTTHIVIGSIRELDGEFFSWVEDAFGFSLSKS